MSENLARCVAQNQPESTEKQAAPVTEKAAPPQSQDPDRKAWRIVKSKLQERFPPAKQLAFYQVRKGTLELWTNQPYLIDITLKNHRSTILDQARKAGLEVKNLVIHKFKPDLQ